MTTWRISKTPFAVPSLYVYVMDSNGNECHLQLETSTAREIGEDLIRHANRVEDLAQKEQPA